VINKAIIFCDGACRGNPGPGGFAAKIHYTDRDPKIVIGKEAHTTNNRMELRAAIEALKNTNLEVESVTVYSDSQYVVKAVKEKWLDNWVKTDFKGGKKNKDLWLAYYELSKRFDIKFVWVKGHADNPFNNRCDELATTAADAPSHELLIDEEYEASVN